jgi:hypothetical protein
VVRKGITLTVGSQSVVDVSLPVGAQTQGVAVEAQAVQVETTNYKPPAKSKAPSPVALRTRSSSA